MTYHKVDSSSIAEVAYDRGTSSLGIRFQAGREYIYALVPEREYRRLITSDCVLSASVHELDGRISVT